MPHFPSIWIPKLFIKIRLLSGWESELQLKFSFKINQNRNFLSFSFLHFCHFQGTFPKSPPPVRNCVKMANRVANANRAYSSLKRKCWSWSVAFACKSTWQVPNVKLSHTNSIYRQRKWKFGFKIVATNRNVEKLMVTQSRWNWKRTVQRT